MFERATQHTIYMSVREGYGHLTIEPPLSQSEYDIAATALRLDHNKKLYEQSFTEDGKATAFKILVDSERHLNGRANRLLIGLEAVGICAELDDTIAHVI